MDSDNESEKEFNKFLMASISGSDLTSGKDTGRDTKIGKSLEWNVSSSDDIESKRRFLKTSTQELDNLLEQKKPKKTEPQGILAALESQFLVGDSMSTEGLTESIERQEFANRLAQNNSALHSLGNQIHHPSPDKMAQTGTLEGLEEFREGVDEVQNDESPPSVNVSSVDDKHQSDISQSESIFSDGSKSTDGEVAEDGSSTERSLNSTRSFATNTEKSETVEDKTTSADDKGYTDEFESVQQPTVADVSNSGSSSGGEVIVALDDIKEGLAVNLYAFQGATSSNSESLSQKSSVKSQVFEKIDFDDESEKSKEDDQTLERDSIDDKSEDETALEKPENFEPQFKAPQAEPTQNFGDSLRSSQSKSMSIADIRPEDFGKTHEISLEDSSLAEILNLYEDKKILQGHKFDCGDFDADATKDISRQREQSPEKDLTKKLYHKKPDFSHVKSSGYGSIFSSQKKQSSRPRISPRLAAKVEAAKNEKRRKSAQLRSATAPVQLDSVAGVDTLKEQLEQEKALRDQLTKTESGQVERYHLAEEEHRREVERALTTQKILLPNAGGDREEDLKLITGYQFENERLYKRTKDLEAQIRETQTGSQLMFTQRNETVTRLESLLGKEEKLRRDIEVTAREAKRQCDDERRRVSELQEDLRSARAGVESEMLLSKRLRDELSLKDRQMSTLMKQLANSTSNDSDFADEIQRITLTRNNEVQKLQLELTKCKSEIEFMSQQTRSRKTFRSSSSQTEISSSSATYDACLEGDIRRLKVENDHLKKEKRDMHSQFHELREKTGRLEISVETQEFEMQKLSDENGKLRHQSERIPLLESKLRLAEENTQNCNLLKTQLQASLDDRQVFEQRYQQSVGSVKVAQGEIDKRQRLVIDMHRQGQQMQKALSCLERDKSVVLVELENARIELELVRQNSLPDNMAHIAKKLSELEANNSNKEIRLRRALSRNDPSLSKNEVMVDQTETILNLKTHLNSKNTQFNKAQLEINTLRNELLRIRNQLSGAAA